MVDVLTATKKQQAGGQNNNNDSLIHRWCENYVILIKKIQIIMVVIQVAHA